MEPDPRFAQGPVPLLVCAALASVACGAPAQTPEEALVAYMNAVQQRNHDALFCLSSGAAEAPELGADATARRAAFSSWADAEYLAYEEGRDEGFVELNESGIRGVKLFALGRGTFFTPGVVMARGPDAAMLRTELTFGYGHVDLSRLSPGTTFYLCAEPVGATVPVRVPAGNREITVDVLEHLTLDWSLTRTEGSDGCANGWAVAGVAPVQGTAQPAELTLVF
jgi:hypothetical protein